MTIDTLSIRETCSGIVPLAARLESWMLKVVDHDLLPAWIEQFGSPLNVQSVMPFLRQVENLKSVAADYQLDFEVFFARKANKCLAYVDAAREIGCGIDTAGDVELTQVIDAGFPVEKIICTAAVKDRNLLTRCVENSVTIAIDNNDELQSIVAICEATNRSANIALRISGFHYENKKMFSRFGFDVDTLPDLIEQLKEAKYHRINVQGLHFHLDGYCGNQRIAAITQSLKLIDELRHEGFAPVFLDMGGGIPMSYLESDEQFQNFKNELRNALRRNRESITWQNHGLGLISVEDALHGKLNVYPAWQQLTQADWLREILEAPVIDGSIGDESVAAAIHKRKIQLRCEPGRSMLDGCGMTVARVEFRKRHPDGFWLIGLAMNHTQCKTSHEDFLVDPLLVKTSKPNSGDRASQQDLDAGDMEGFLVGAYCTEFELLTLRRLRFPGGVDIGDLIVFPNTAGYLMHFRESRSHQFPLAKNVFVDRLLLDDIIRLKPALDSIDM